MMDYEIDFPAVPGDVDAELQAKVSKLLSSAKNKAEDERKWMEHPPRPSVPKRTADAQRRFAELSRTGLANTVVEAGVARTRFKSAIATGPDPAVAEKWNDILSKFMRDTSFERTANTAVWDAAVDGASALIVGDNADGPFIQSERLGTVAFERSTDMPAWKPSLAVKRVSKNKLRVWDGETERVFERDGVGNNWKATSSEPQSMPVTIVEARLDGDGVFAKSHAALQRVQTAIFQQMSVSSANAAKLRAIQQTAAGKDETVDLVNPESMSELASAADGGIMLLPPGTELVEGKEGTLQSVNEHVKSQLALLCSETGTPLSMFHSDSANASAEGARSQTAALVARAETAQEMAADGIRMALVKVLRSMGMPDEVTIEVIFSPAEQRTMESRMRSMQLAVSAGWSPAAAGEAAGGFSAVEMRKWLAAMETVEAESVVASTEALNSADDTES